MDQTSGRIFRPSRLTPHAYPLTVFLALTCIKMPCYGALLLPQVEVETEAEWSTRRGCISLTLALTYTFV
jgi:hypothetical protein